jgi:uncharacterized membrane protein
MKPKLALSLSMFGLAMALATVWVVPPALEPFCWLAIFAFCAITIARNAEQKVFLHGLLVSITNSAWMTSAHIVFAERYLAHHPQEAAMAATMSSPRLMMLVTGPIVGVASGLVLGLLAWIASRFVKPVAARTDPPRHDGAHSRRAGVRAIAQ